MVFSSVIFLCFFLPVMIAGYYILPRKLSNLFLVLGSLFFYAWGGPEYIFIMLASIAGNYVFGLLIGRSRDDEGSRSLSIRRVVLIASVLYNLGILFYFKYFTFILTTIHDITGKEFYIPETVLPIGISFYTFQGMSYVIDVYRQPSLVQKNPLNLALYISMFPQLIAGPIVRYTDIRDRLPASGRRTDAHSFALGIERFIIGLSKKAILANSIGEVADRIFSSEVQYLGVMVAWLGAVCYTLQIYYDFSGYSDMAIGLGKIFGFDFMENFNYPYISTSIRDFWRRWHISLSSWFRDYLYIPLGGNRKGNVYLNLIIVFIATGIWHGAAWGFVIWGLWHGLFSLAERFVTNRAPAFKLPAPVGWLYTMLVVILGWVLFKLEELPKALSYIGAMFGIDGEAYVAFSPRFYLDNRMIVIILAAILAMIPWKNILAGRAFIPAFAGKLLMPAKRILLVILLLLSMMFVVNSTYNPFIYFRF
ncbi:MAG TPA: membrane-bound O-acyltransferase family protein [Lachnospiraceae bacterium]|nr:membrane-bound O-acyltransferase family protein [Lachnospiraceae bacterium]